MRSLGLKEQSIPSTARLGKGVKCLLTGHASEGTEFFTIRHDINPATRWRCKSCRKRSIHSHHLATAEGRHSLQSLQTNTPGRKIENADKNSSRLSILSGCTVPFAALPYSNHLRQSLRATFLNLAQHLVPDKSPPSPPSAHATSPSRKDHDLDRHPNTSRGSSSRRRASPSRSASLHSIHTTAASTACFLPVGAHS